MPSRPNFYRILMILLTVWSIGCSRMEVPIPIMHPAEINLQGRNQVRIDHLRGQGGSEIETHLRDILSQSPTLSLFGAQTKKEGPIIGYQPATSPKSDQPPPSPIVVRGDVADFDYDEQMSRTVTTCTRRVKRNDKYVDETYNCPHYTRTGLVKVRAGFQVIDDQTGQVIRSKSVRCEDRRQTEATNDTPIDIDYQSMLDKCAYRVAFYFSKTISPWKEEV
ncbi:MAG: hypothetical protein HQK55_14685 [Deltaproteobacteria bacterium]|nr:hypothetical protein [Deltaproteobacteria bacterium]